MMQRIRIDNNRTVWQMVTPTLFGEWPLWHCLGLPQDDTRVLASGKISNHFGSFLHPKNSRTTINQCGLAASIAVVEPCKQPLSHCSDDPQGLG